MAALVFMVPIVLLAAGKFPYSLFYLVALAAIVPHWRLRRSLRNLRGEITVSSRTSEVGQSFEVNYKIINSDKGTFPYLELSHATDGLQHDSPYICLNSGEIKEFSRRVFCKRRGTYDLNSLTVKTGDPFGLFQLQKPLAEGGKVKVYPPVRHFPGINVPTPNYLGDHKTKNAVFENQSELSGLREWQDGDSLKRIHWKQSAKQERIIVKDYEHTADAEFTLFLNMHQEGYKHDEEHLLEDLAIELAASLVYHRLSEGLSVHLFSASIPGSPLKGKRLGDYERIVDLMIDLAPDQAGSFFSYLRQQTYFLLPNTTLYVITPSLTLTDADLLLSLKRKGFSVVVLFLSPHDLKASTHKIFGRMREAGIRVHTTYTSTGETNHGV